MVASSAASISRAGDGTLTHMLILFTMITMYSSTSKARKYAFPFIHFFQLIIRQVYVLPDGYPVSDPSLEDIAYVLAPRFNQTSIGNLYSPNYLSKPSYDLNHQPYIPGYVGLNNIKRNDHMNVIIHSLLHVPPLRDHLLRSDFRGKESELLKRFAGLAKKLWNPCLFKSQVSPHEFLQEVNRASAGKFRLEQQGDPVEFLGWLLNHLHRDLGGSKKKDSSESACLT